MSTVAPPTAAAAGNLRVHFLVDHHDDDTARVLATPTYTPAAAVVREAGTKRRNAPARPDIWMYSPEVWRQTR